MIRCLAIGDSHIPRRAQMLHTTIINKLHELSQIDLFAYTFFTGDVIDAKNFIDFLTQITKNPLLMVMGNMDYYTETNAEAPFYQHLDILFSNDEMLTIGLTHGAHIEPRGDHSQLELLAMNHNYHILITGHTHLEEIHLTKCGILLINPGSVTGAWSFLSSGIPSFITLTVNETNKDIKITLFQLDIKNDEIKESNASFIFQDNQILPSY